MLKIKTTDSNITRILKSLFQGFLIGAVVGGPLGFIVGFFGLEDGLKLPMIQIIEVLQYLIYAAILVTIILTINYVIVVRRDLGGYQEAEDEDEQEKLYSVLGRKSSYATVFSGMAIVFSMINTILGYRVIFESESARIEFPVFAILTLFISIGLQLYVISLSNRIRGYKATLVPTYKELKNNVYHLDEAELEANKEMSYEIVLTLSQVILPGIYVFLMFLGFIFQKVELTSILIVASIHIYILVMNFKMAKSHYK